MGMLSYKKQREYKEQVISFMNSWMRYNWGKFSAEEFRCKLTETEKSMYEWKTNGLKHTKLSKGTKAYIWGYFDAIRNRIENEETVFVYNIFGKNYGCFDRDLKDGFEKYNVLPREIWTHPDFCNLGRRIWKATQTPYYGWERLSDLPKFPAMSFWESNKVVYFHISNSGEKGSQTTGSFPLMITTNKYINLMEIAKNHNVSIINMEDLTNAKENKNR